MINDNILCLMKPTISVLFKILISYEIYLYQVVNNETVMKLSFFMSTLTLKFGSFRLHFHSNKLSYFPYLVVFIYYLGFVINFN